MARVKVQITTPSNNVIKVSPGVSALSSVQLYLNELIDVNSAHGAEGHVLTQQSDGTFAMEAVATTLSDLSDTNIPTPQGGDSLVYDAASQKWVPGGVKSVNGQDGDVVITIPSPPPTPGVSGLADTNITSLQDDQIIRYDSFSGEWLNEDLEALPAGGTTGQALVKATGTDYDVEWADIAIDTQYHNRFQTDAETFRSGATETVELYYTAKADGDGLAESASSDTPTAGNIIKRKIYYSEEGFADPDTGTWVEFTPAPADDASFATVKAALLEYLKARTGGTVPISLKQTWEEVSATAYLLDETFGSGAEAAYSTRQLRNAATECMVIRRASDSTTTTIGFDGSGNISEADIISFCTGTTCTVYQWLDQSGNGNTATAAAPANEPTIYTGGALVKENGKVAVQLDGINDYLNASTSDLFGTNFALYFVHRVTGGSARKFLIETTSTGSSVYNPSLEYSESALPSKIRTFSGSAATTTVNIESSIQFDSSRRIVTVNKNGTTNLELFADGSSLGTATPPNVTGMNGFNLGSYRDGNARYFGGTFQEVILYDADKSGTDQTSIEENIGDYFTQNTPLLDTYSGAAAAYSLRLLDSSYVGSAVEVYNGSSYADIGFNVFGELDTVALADHCGSNDGFVSKWYSQTGSNHATQTNTANMPKIYDGTTGVITRNGKPCIVSLDGGVYYGPMTTSLSIAEPYTVSFVGRDNNNYGFLLGNNEQIKIQLNAVLFQSEDLDGGNNLVGQYQHILGVGNGVNSFGQTKATGAQPASVSFTSGGANLNLSIIGGRFSYASSSNRVDYSELIVWESDQETAGNTANIQSNINTFYNIY